MTYAICNVCGREMTPGSGCGQPDLYVGKKKVARVRHSDEGNCHDCNAGYGHVHHWNCDWERCPTCGLQLLGCECDISIEVRKEVNNAAV